MVLLRAERDYKGDMEALSLEIEQVQYLKIFGQQIFSESNRANQWNNIFISSRLWRRRLQSLRGRGLNWSPAWSTCLERSWRRMNGEDDDDDDYVTMTMITMAMIMITMAM